MNLRVPGPTPLPPEVLQAEAKPMINHRSKDFAQIQNRVVARLKESFQTANDLLLLTGSGTGAMEAAVVNTLSPGDRVLAVSIGNFGDRFADIAATFGAEVVRLTFGPGEHADPDAVRTALAQDPTLTAVLVTHNETSTGVTNPLEDIAGVVREFDKLLIVDGISSVGSIEIKTDAWGLDVVVSGSQKGWMAPPGLSMITMSERAWAAYRQAQMPRFYWDVGKAKKSLERGETPWTPAVSVVYALDAGLELLSQEGFANVYARHARLAAMTRQGIKDLGLKLVAQEERYASNTVTAVWAPEGIEERAIRSTLRQEFDIELAGGQGELTGKIFRIGHLGYVSEADLQAVLDALRVVLPRVGFSGAGAAGARG
ncbi:MAG: alanine--glyoxylate aminotransferase family protein [Chloroflexi bacterium]|nr:alanine--glyoxylate aminotransferase family protein [Chloroflexota bacterium]